jgi:hypothetical protein
MTAPQPTEPDATEDEDGCIWAMARAAVVSVLRTTGLL